MKKLDILLQSEMYQPYGSNYKIRNSVKALRTSKNKTLNFSLIGTSTSPPSKKTNFKELNVKKINPINKSLKDLRKSQKKMDIKTISENFDTLDARIESRHLTKREMPQLVEEADPIKDVKIVFKRRIG